MALEKKEFVNGQTVIMAEDMNAIQDAIIDNEESIGEIRPVVEKLGGIKLLQITPGDTSIATGATKSLTFKGGIKGILYIFGASNNTIGHWMINANPNGVVYISTASATGSTAITVTVNATNNKRLDIKNGTSTVNIKAYMLIFDGEVENIVI